MDIWNNGLSLSAMRWLRERMCREWNEACVRVTAAAAFALLLPAASPLEPLCDACDGCGSTIGAAIGASGSADGSEKLAPRVTVLPCRARGVGSMAGC